MGIVNTYTSADRAIVTHDNDVDLYDYLIVKSVLTIPDCNPADQTRYRLQILTRF